jgi:hypothetical protein
MQPDDAPDVLRQLVCRELFPDSPSYQFTDLSAYLFGDFYDELPCTIPCPTDRPNIGLVKADTDLHTGRQ